MTEGEGDGLLGLDWADARTREQARTGHGTRAPGEPKRAQRPRPHRARARQRRATQRHARLAAPAGVPTRTDPLPLARSRPRTHEVRRALFVFSWSGLDGIIVYSEVGEHQLPNRVRRLHGDLTAILRAGPKLVRERRGAAAVSRGRRRNLRHSVWSDRRPLVILGDPVAVAGDVAQSTSARATPLRRRRAGSSFGRVRSRLVQDAASWRGIRPETSLIRIALGTRRINVNVDEQAIGSSRCRS